MINSMIDTICFCCSSGDQDARIQLQIAKTLASCALAAHPDPLLHSTSLLKVVRTTYTLFLLSKNTNVQLLAQSTVYQMVNTIFNRVLQSHEIAEEEQILGSMSVSTFHSLTEGPFDGHTQGQSQGQVQGEKQTTRQDSITDISLSMTESPLKDTKSVDEKYFLFF